MFKEMITATTPFEDLLQQFASVEGDSVFTNPNFTEFKPLFYYLSSIFKPLSALSKEIALVKTVLNQIETSFKQEFSFYLRYMNLGLKLRISCPDLISFINNL